MNRRSFRTASCFFLLSLFTLANAARAADAPAKEFDVEPPHVSADESVTLDYDIVYVRSPRWVNEGDRKRPARWAEFAHIFNVTPGSDLVLLHPDGSEEVLVEGGAGAIQDPYVSFDGESVYYTRFHEATRGPNQAGADVYRIHVPTRKITRLTTQEFTPNKPGTEQRYGVYNMHPCPLPGGRVAFVSSRNGFLPPPKSYPQVALQLHVMDDDGSNVETIGHLNMAGALHPVILKDGRIIFSSLENMGLRNYILWGIWSIHPDGTNWAPVVSALHGKSSPSSWHFQTQLSDENVVVELYYNQNQKGFGPLFKLPPKAPYGEAAFGPGDLEDPRNAGWEFVYERGDGFELRNGFRFPFTPYGMSLLTPWIVTNDRPAHPLVAGDRESTRIGKVTHPCGAPDNHLLLAWTLGPIGGSAGAVRDYMHPRVIDSGLYLLKDGATTYEPGDLRLIKNAPDFNEQWPRPLVSYERIHGVAEPRDLTRPNDGKASPHLPEGTPFGLVGTSSFYKRETAPMGRVEEGSVTATFPKDYRGRGWDAEDSEYMGTSWNWRGQGADAGRYTNEDVHAVRIVAFEPNAHTNVEGNRRGYPPYANHAMERLRILGEIPLRKFVNGEQPTDPDGNPDTSFLAKIPADVPFTFQTLDEEGMVLNMAQTWHQVRPGEVRHDCGGCHAHSQQPTPFAETFAASSRYELFDLVERTPLVTSKSQDESGKRWDVDDAAGLKFVEGPHDVEYFRDVKPILERSCVACHTKDSDDPAAGLVLDDDDTSVENLPGTYFRLAADERARFSPRKVETKGRGDDLQYVVRDLFSKDSASHYVWKFQSRRSLLAWKIFGRRLDGWSNDTMETEFVEPGDPRRENLHVPRGEVTDATRLYFGDVDYTGSQMPPADAVKSGKVEPLSDEDRRTIVRWIDLGCPIDLDSTTLAGDPNPNTPGYPADDTRPTLTVTRPAVGENPPLSRILIGLHDYDSGLDLDRLHVSADFAIDGVPAGENLADRLQALPGNRWELRLKQPVASLERGTLTVSVQDRAGNVNRVERAFSIVE